MPQKDFSFTDQVYGRIKIQRNNLDDSILLKSDGYPTYHFANVIDDHLMKISHVLRGMEWISSTPLHLAIYDAFNWNPPEFAHLPLLVHQDGKKLSKRDSDSMLEGYEPEAILNFLAFLGWNPKTTQDIFTLDELIDQVFSIDCSFPLVVLTSLLQL